MAAKSKTTFVPLHSIIVTRGDKQVDALVEYKTTGKAFEFTQDEIDEITAGHDGNVGLALRAPSDEAVDVEEIPAGGQAAADAPQGTATKTAKSAAKDADL